MVIAGVVSRDGWALPTATCWRVAALARGTGLMALTGHSGSSSVQVAPCLGPLSALLGESRFPHPQFSRMKEVFAFSLNKTQRCYRVMPEPPLC